MNTKAEWIIEGMETSDGGGVNLKRIIGQPKLRELDPFLLLDEFKSDDPEDYIAGFPEHPHRGFSTLTYMKYGQFRHKDSLGNTGHLGEGSLQWMTAGRGVRHSEMPMMENGLLWGFQLWVNLPASAKMMEPFYKDIPASSVPVIRKDHAVIKLLAGNLNGVPSAVPEVWPFFYADVLLGPDASAELPASQEDSILLYLYNGSLILNLPENEDSTSEVSAEGGRLIRLKAGSSSVTIKAGSTTSPSLSDHLSGTAGAEFLYLSGKPTGEPIVRRGPFVMNTEEEIRAAYREMM